ncbi:hypothetical protein AVEN_223494-1 [Araneus ventricosus]|uniref:Uncharacterized protein n=1 Tax=Araneus ventricosus TaxID=182803 RepID=A0A4Y2DIE3_ARAVE|nr:hypothetical protein AVEN_223494-1 [Araneus ventricosus]
MCIFRFISCAINLYAVFKTEKLVVASHEASRWRGQCGSRRILLVQRFPTCGMCTPGVPKRTIFEWEKPETTESEQLADISPTAIERLPTEEEILREYPPYTLPIEPGDYQDDVTHESRGNNIFPSVSDGEQVTISEPVVEIQNCKVDEGEVILFPSVSNGEQVPISELIVEVQTCDDNVREEILDASISGEIENIKVGNKNSENNWGSRLRPRDRSGFVKK